MFPKFTERRHELRLERGDGSITTNRIINATFELVQFCEQVHPAKVFRRERVAFR